VEGDEALAAGEGEDEALRGEEQDGDEALDRPFGLRLKMLEWIPASVGVSNCNDPIK
jgi:hypothetical protein